MKLKMPWQKDPVTSSISSPVSSTCAHPHVEVEMHGTAIKRRWCSVCGAELPIAERGEAE